MYKRHVLLGIACLLLIVLQSSAQCANQVSWVYDLIDNGGGSYTYQFTFNNQGPAKDAIFKVQLKDCVSDQWSTAGLSTPTGWDSSQSGSNINFQTDNGDMSIYRIFGQTGAPEPSPGWTSQTFGWTFNAGSGSTPTSDYFNESNVKIHLQEIDDNWHNIGDTYPVNPVPEPSSLVALGLSVFSLGAWVLRKRR